MLGLKPSGYIKARVSDGREYFFENEVKVAVAAALQAGLYTGSCNRVTTIRVTYSSGGGSPSTATANGFSDWGTTTAGFTGAFHYLTSNGQDSVVTKIELLAGATVYTELALGSGQFVVPYGDSLSVDYWLSFSASLAGGWSTSSIANSDPDLQTILANALKDGSCDTVLYVTHARNDKAEEYQGGFPTLSTLTVTVGNSQYYAVRAKTSVWDVDTSSAWAPGYVRLYSSGSAMLDERALSSGEHSDGFLLIDYLVYFLPAI